MEIKKVLSTSLLGLGLIFGSGNTAQGEVKSNEPSRLGRLEQTLENSGGNKGTESNYKHYKPNTWFFDDTRYCLSTNITPDSEVIKPLYTGEGCVKAKFQGILDELDVDFGWFARFFFIPGASVNLIMSEFDAVDGYKSNKTLVDWLVSLEFRYYPGDFWIFKDKNWFIGLDDTHHSRDEFPKDINLEEYGIENPDFRLFPHPDDPNKDFHQLDPISFQLGYRFPIGNNCNFQGRIGYQPYQTVPNWIFAALSNKDKRLPYPYPVFSEDRFGCEFVSGIEAYIILQTEVPHLKRRKKIPTDFMLGIRFGGFNIIGKKSVGGLDNSIEYNRYPGFHVDGKALYVEWSKPVF